VASDFRWQQLCIIGGERDKGTREAAAVGLHMLFSAVESGLGELQQVI
jgi:hypothetical protein